MKPELEELKLENFEAHTDTVIKFDKGVNVIVGPTDKGKSGLFRGMNWPIENRPLGNSYRSWYGGDAKSILTFKDVKVQRFRSDTENNYKLTGYKKPFSSIGNKKPPEEIRDALKIDKEINIQHQRDNFFLLAKSPGDVAVHFNKIAKLEKIDSTINNGKRDVRLKNVEITKVTEDLKGKEKELETFETLDNLNTLIEAYEKNVEYLDLSQIKKQKIYDAVKNILIIDNEISGYQKKIKVLPLIKKVIKNRNKIEELEDKKVKIQWIIDNITDLGAEKRQLEKKLKLLPLIKDCLKNKKVIRKLKKDRNSILSIVNSIKDIDYKINELEKEYTGRKSVLTANMPDKCPLCGRSE